MQIIFVSRHLKSARTVTIMPRHVAIAVAGFLALVFALSVFLSALSVHFRLPLVEDVLRSIQQQESRQTQDYITNNLQLMATRLGEIQGRMLQLDSLGERVSDLAGIKQPAETVGRVPAGAGGPYLPAPMSASELQQEIERLAADMERQVDELAFVEARLLEQRVAKRLLPTTLPVESAVIGSGFGYRIDPFVGLRSRHEGLDFNAPVGTPVVAAADGVVLATSYHPEYGKVVDIDHGDGLISRYAHLSVIDVAESKIIRRGERLGAVGNTGRSTGSHLHFEVRMRDVAQNPLTFLKRGEGGERLARR